jgi:hypothetical protein
MDWRVLPSKFAGTNCGGEKTERKGVGGEKKSLFKEMVVTDGQTYAGGQGQAG